MHSPRWLAFGTLIVVRVHTPYVRSDRELLLRFLFLSWNHFDARRALQARHTIR